MQESIVASHEPGSEIMIVAHGGSGKAVLGYATGLSIEELFAWPAIGNATMTIMTREGDRWILSEALDAADQDLLQT